MGNSPSAPSYDTQSSLAEKLLQKQPIVIAFLSPSCGLCRAIEPRLAEVKQKKNISTHCGSDRNIATLLKLFIIPFSAFRRRHQDLKWLGLILQNRPSGPLKCLHITLKAFRVAYFSIPKVNTYHPSIIFSSSLFLKSSFPPLPHFSDFAGRALGKTEITRNKTHMLRAMDTLFANKR